MSVRFIAALIILFYGNECEGQCDFYTFKTPGVASLCKKRTNDADFSSGSVVLNIFTVVCVFHWT